LDEKLGDVCAIDISLAALNILLHI
jgi:hypothetical protein